MNRSASVSIHGLAATLVIAMLAASGALAGDDRPGYAITASGYQMPVYGSVAVERPDGSLGTACKRLTHEQIGDLELTRLTAMSVADAPQVTLQAEGGITFVVSYTDAEGVGFNDPELGETRRAAFEASLAPWSGILQGTVPVAVAAGFLDEGGDTLASAGPTEFYTVTGREGINYPGPLAMQLAGQDLSAEGTPDITANFGGQIDWDYALDGATSSDPDKVSFVYTAIHELGHGLGFLDCIDTESGEFLNAAPCPYDQFLNRGSEADNRLLNRSAGDRLQDIVSDDLFFNGPSANEASAVAAHPNPPLPMVKLFAPTEYQQGSSVSHTDQETYAFVETGLMVPSAFGTSSNHIDILSAAIMRDLGYLGVVAEPAPEQ